jgi:hypothetical protein
MKKLISILLCAALLCAFAACGEVPADTESSAVPTAKSLFPSAKLTPTPAPLLAPTEKRETVNADGKPIIYIGSFSSGSFEIEDSFVWLNTAVRNFNYKWEAEYEARVIDYGDATVSESLYRLNAEIISGKMPDMLITHGMPIDNYLKLDLLYDMSDWLDPEKFFAGPLEAMKTNGKLYEVSPAITVTSFYGLEKYLGESASLPLDEIYAIWEKFNVSGDKDFIAGLPNEIIAMLLISAYEDQFVDRNAATCNFNSPEFIKLLEFCKKLPDNPTEINVKADTGLSTSWSASILQTPDLHRAIAVRKEAALLGVFATQRDHGIPFFTHYYVTAALNGVDYSFIGYPGANNASVYLDFPLAVSANCAYIGGAQDFVDSLWSLTFLGGSAKNVRYMPLKRSTMKTFNDYQLKDLSYMKDITKRDDALLWGAFGESAPLYTLEEFSEFEEIINSASIRVRSPIASYIPPFNNSQMDPNRQFIAPSASTFLNPIIAEEIQAFFGGIQDVSRTAELIQSRYSVYLSEQAN